MAVVSSEVSSIKIASSAAHRSPLELHPRSSRCESQVDKDGRLVRISSEKALLDGQSEVETGDLAFASGSTCDHPQQATIIEAPVASEPPPPTVLPQTNDQLVNVENALRFSAEAALRDRAPSVLEVEDRLAQIRHKVSESQSDRIYVPLRANPNPQVSNKTALPLLPTVLEFLESELRVFLLLGDSGSGKSTFCRQLVRTLWSNYTQGSRIPIFVDLRDIDRPSDDLIESQLQEHGFSDADVQELLHQRQFVLVCDGYDESRFSTSIYTKRLGQLDVKMIVSCRNTYLGRDYQCRFYPLGDDKYHDKSSELFQEATIVPFQKSDIQEFVKQYVLGFADQEPSDNPPAPSFDDYWEKLSAIPNLMDLVSNPFLLTLALRVLPSLSIDLQDLTKNKATRLQLYDGFVKKWIRINITRLQRSTLSQEYRSVFESLLNDGFAWCVKDFSKRLAEAMHEHQRGRLVVRFSCKHNEPWKVEFFGQEIDSTLLRESSLLSRAGICHWFIHKSLFDYFRSLVFYDPDETDDDDPDDVRGDPHGGGGNSFSDGGDYLFDHGDFNGGDGSLSGGDFVATTDSGGSDGGGSGGPMGSSSGSTGASSDSSGGNGGSSGSNGGSADINSGSLGDNSASTGGIDGSGNKDGPSGNGDSSHQGKDGYRSRRKASKNKSRPFGDSFSTQNLIEDPEVLEFLVERAQSDSLFEKRLLSVIEQSKAFSVPSVAAANAITILFKSGKRSQDTVLEGVPIPSDYMSTATGSTEPVQSPESNIQVLSKALKTNSTLTTLDLFGNSIGRDGAQALSEARKTNSTLNALKLISNWSASERAQALFEALNTNSTLTTLDLRNNRIGDNGAQAPSEALKTNSTPNTLNLTSNWSASERAQALFVALKTNSTLTTLDLSYNSIGSDGAQALSEALKTNSTLTTLNLTDNWIGRDGAQALSEALKINSTLTTLDLRDNSIGRDGAQALSEALKINSTLTTLNLTYNSIERDGAQTLFEALKTNSTLTTLDLSGNSIGCDGAQALSEALKINSTLTTLDLSGNLIGRDGAQALSEALKINSTLTTLVLRGNWIGPDGAQALSEALKINSTLTTLVLSGNWIGPDGAQALSEALKINSTLTTLDLSRNSIGPDGAQALSEALKINSTLTTLVLSGNYIGDDRAQALSDAIKRNSRVR
ncbi:hypothetical protein KI688_007671 [Linnemannia hyalina]|uniref:NACHT domain-containing protein n=1 Tax=Linnemannia hyalina TaxID=64524 RepID=A0A9P7XI62_9FUNG|nr:hypothetical protein KI688_007671 [Linnemannia hyalina]